MDYNHTGRPAAAPAPRPFDQPAQPATSGGKGSKKGPKFTMAKAGFLFVVVVATVVLIGLMALLFTTKENGTTNEIQTDKYQAIFLNSADGQVYFGKMSVLNNQYYKLTDIYYVRVENKIQPGKENQTQQNISLAKLGSEIHGPQDTMYINKDHVLFWENLKDDGQVVKAIKDYVNQQKNGGNNNQQNQQNNNQ